MKLPFKFPAFGRKKRKEDDDEDGFDSLDDLDEDDEGGEDESGGETLDAFEGGIDEDDVEGGDLDEDDFDEDGGYPRKGGTWLARARNRIAAPGKRRLLIGAAVLALLVGGGVVAVLVLTGGEGADDRGPAPPDDTAAADSRPGSASVALDPRRPAFSRPGMTPPAEGSPADGHGDRDRTAASPPVTAPPIDAPARPVDGRAGAPDDVASGPYGGLTPPASTPLPAAPDSALIEVAGAVALPRIAENGRMPRQAYAAPPAQAPADLPRIAIVITELGLDAEATEAALKLLPGPVSAALSPYGTALDRWMAVARHAGHEVFLTVPMESSRFPAIDAGPESLAADREPPENMTRLMTFLARFSGYVGVLGRYGGRFAKVDAQVRPMMEVLAARGLMYVESGDRTTSQAPRIAAEIGLPRVLVDLWLDDDPDPRAIDARLADLEGVAIGKAAAVAAARPYPSTVRRLAAWVATLTGKQLVLTPLSDLAGRQFLE